MQVQVHVRKLVHTKGLQLKFLLKLVSNFQVLARLMAALHFLWPVVLNLFAFTNYDNSPFLNTCRGKDHFRFFSTEMHYCTYDNPYKVCICWVWISILVIGNSKFQINTLARIKMRVRRVKINVFIKLLFDDVST